MAKTKTKKEPPEFENLGSMITIKGSDRCLGYLMDFEGHDVFEPDIGRVDVSPEHAKLHNEAFEKALLEGLDNNCEVGMCGSFYLGKKDGRYEVHTFLGQVVSDETTRSEGGSTLTFFRKGKAFQGRISKKSDLFNFKRVH